MAIHFATNRFPSSGDDKDRIGIPFGCVIHPLAELKTSARVHDAILPARCQECFAYINPYVRFSRYTWRCSLCRHESRLSERYASHQARVELPELTRAFVEYELLDGQAFGASPSASLAGECKESSDLGPSKAPVYIFCVDVSGRSEYVELVKTSLLAVIEALPSACWVGLLVFSTRLGIYDLRGTVPHVRYAQIPCQRSDRSLSLSDLLPLGECLVQLGASKDRLGAALESLTSHVPERGEADDAAAAADPVTHVEHKDRIKHTPGAPVRERGFGVVVSALTEYLAADGAELNARVLTFLAGRPNFGVGALADRYGPEAKGRAPDRDLLQPQTNFYKEQAERAAHAGVCFDLYVVSELEYVDLASIKFLSLLTGGNLLLYEELEECSLPQDLFRQFKKPQGFSGLLRVRTPPEFQVAAVYGHLAPDRKYENLYHLAGCDTRKTLAIDFEFTSSSGLDSHYESRPVMQLAFAYTTLAESDTLDAEGLPVLVPVRRLRVHSRRLECARAPLEVYQHVQAEAILAQLTHQIIHASLDKGIEEARALIKDWLINVTACFNDTVLGITGRAETGAKASPQTVNSKFSRAENMQFIPGLVFGMLKNKLLSMNHVHPDVRVATHCLYSALEPPALAKALYPCLSAYATANTLSRTTLYLSRATMKATDCSIFLIDALTGIYVYYTETAKDSFPPPHDSELRKAIKKLKARAPLVTPRVVFAQAGTPDARFFLANLLEEEDASGFTFATFNQSIVDSVVQVLNG